MEISEKKLLHISASPKPQSESVSKEAAGVFIRRLMSQATGYQLEELDLYTSDIPEPAPRQFDQRSHLLAGDAYEALSAGDKAAVDRMNALATQFLEADTYVISAPMWGMSFPSKLKQYLDCIFLNGRLFSLDDSGFHGLLGDRERRMVYIESCGGVYPKILYGPMHYGVRYCHDMFHHLGISSFDTILVQGTDMPRIGRYKALEDAENDMDDVLCRLAGPHPMPVGAA